MKKLSIVVATYNRAPYLLRTLESLARQTLSPGLFEILVVNNNSSDNTPEVVAGFAGSHPQLQVRMVTETSQGISYARNCGIASSVGQYIVFIDDDEEANPEFAKSYFCFFENNPGLDAAGGGCSGLRSAVAGVVLLLYRENDHRGVRFGRPHGAVSRETVPGRRQFRFPPPAVRSVR